MKAFDFSKWDLSGNGSKGMLFFAQTIEEMLFHYGHDSLKVPALNFRYLCVETISTIYKIEADIIENGNMIPLLEELKDSFENDLVVRELYGSDFNSLFYGKDAEGKLSKDCGAIFKDPKAEKSIKKIKKMLEYLIEDMELGDKYFETLKTNIMKTIKMVPFSFNEQQRLYRLCKILLTDLINRSYSQEYIYWLVNDIFYNSSREIKDVDFVFDLFWSCFDFKEKEYMVIIPVKQSALEKHLKEFKSINVLENEEKYLKGLGKWVVEIKVRAMDQQRALKNAKAYIDFLVSLLQYNNHKSQSFYTNKAIVVLNETKERFNIQDPITPLKRSTNLNAEKRNKKIEALMNNLEIENLMSAIMLHASAVNAAEIKNQLLNLWTIVEILVPTEPRNSFSKINQICNVVTSVLNAKYISSLIEQLFLDLTHCVPEEITVELELVSNGANEIEKLVAILVLEEYAENKARLLEKLRWYPLLQYRIENYATVFSDRNRIKKCLLAHNKRVALHLARIYRNRNMIVHDGSHFPYMNIIVQNLHYYVDLLIDTIIQCANKGYDSLDTIYYYIQQKEYRYILLLEEVDGNKKTKKIDTSDFSSVVLGYLK